MFTNFDKAWFGPAFGSWIANGLIQFSERFFQIDIPHDMEQYVTLAIVGVVVYFIPNKPKDGSVPPSPDKPAPVAAAVNKVAEVAKAA